MLTLSKRLFPILFTIAFMLGGVAETKAQANNLKKLRKIVSTLQAILPNGWRVESSQMNVLPEMWDENFRAYMIVLRNPTIEFESRMKGPDDRIYRYNPYYRLYFVPRTSDMTSKNLQESFGRARRNLGVAQQMMAALCGAGNEYVLLCWTSEKTGWDDGFSKIAKKFKLE